MVMYKNLQPYQATRTVRYISEMCIRPLIYIDKKKVLAAAH